MIRIDEVVFWGLMLPACATDVHSYGFRLSRSAAILIDDESGLKSMCGRSVAHLKKGKNAPLEYRLSGPCPQAYVPLI